MEESKRQTPFYDVDYKEGKVRRKMLDGSWGSHEEWAAEVSTLSRKWAAERDELNRPRMEEKRAELKREYRDEIFGRWLVIVVITLIIIGGIWGRA